MATRTFSNIKLGLFVLAGLLLLILGLYMIGRNSNLFGRNYELKARFENVQGLTEGNNIRYSGIQAGTVKKIKILSDTVIEVTMSISDRMKPFIHKNDYVNIGTDGLMGNKLILINPAKDNSPLAAEGDLLPARKAISTDEMLETLAVTSSNLVFISEELKEIVHRVNNSNMLWKILEDETLPADIKTSLTNIRQATTNANEFVAGLNIILDDIKKGKGSLGAIVSDTAIAYNLNEAVIKIKSVADQADELAEELTTLTGDIKGDVNHGKGPVNALLKDSVIVIKLHNSLTNIEQATKAFDENMEALKHNFLLRGYFRRQEKQKNKEAAKTGK